MRIQTTIGELMSPVELTSEIKANFIATAAEHGFSNLFPETCWPKSRIIVHEFFMTEQKFDMWGFKTDNNEYAGHALEAWAEKLAKFFGLPEVAALRLNGTIVRTPMDESNYAGLIRVTLEDGKLNHRSNEMNLNLTPKTYPDMH